MSRCPSCKQEILTAGHYCPACGASLDSSTVATKGVVDGNAVTQAHSQSFDSTSDTIDHGRFIPGTLLGDRYRIVGLLGRGGMGEVYKADDLSLGQTVALKVLPPDLASEPHRIERFRSEVRLSRQISHANVCRVYDIAELNDLHVLSMEYVDGENLSALLKRIGHMPRERALKIARQLCAGLAAAHIQGVLHRDLKPSNVMIDAQGNVRITDFGLASLIDSAPGDAGGIGTPGYMSPEQLTGGGPSPHSDVYALGLVLYELFTGHPAFKADSIAEVVKLHQHSAPTNPTEHVTELDTAVERVILQCLEKNPGQRPQSALAVAAALPGGDPLAAALAAGETPAPELVAASTEEGSLRPVLGLLALFSIIVGLIVTAMLAGKVKLYGRAPLEKSPEVLSEKSREIISDLGFDYDVADTAFGFTPNSDYLQHLQNTDQTAGRWERLSESRPPAITFWYRQSPRYLVPRSGSGFVSYSDPVMDIVDMVSLRLDGLGRLIEFRAVPSQIEQEGLPPVEVDWTALFAAAGLDPSDYTQAEPEWSPPVYADSRISWTGAAGIDDTDETYPFRIEAAAYGGRPVYFQLRWKWTRAERESGATDRTSEQLEATVTLTLVITVLLGGLWLARHNSKLGRGDRRGSIRVALYLFLANLAAWVLRADHTPQLLTEFSSFIVALGPCIFFAGSFWIMYMALEPYARKRWPHRLIAWSRILTGKWKDPIVGRDILLGVLFALGAISITQLFGLAHELLGLAPPVPLPTDWLSLCGGKNLLGNLFFVQVRAVFNALFFLLIPLLLFVLLRRNRIAVGLSFVILTAVFSVGNENLMLAIPFSMAMVVLWLTLTLRFGLFASAVGFMVYSILFFSPLTLDFSSWYVGGSAAVLAVVLGVSLFGYYLSLAGRPFSSGKLLRE